MALTYVGGTSVTNATASSTYDVSLTGLTGGSDSAPSAGDIVVVVTGWVQTTDGDPGVTTSGYTELGDAYADDNADVNLSVNYKIMGGTPDTSVTVNSAASTTFASGTAVHVWRGVDTTTPIDASIGADGISNSNIIDPYSITPVTSGAIVLHGGISSDYTSNPTAGPTAPSDGSTNTVSSYYAAASRDLEIGIASYAWSSGAYDPGAWTMNVSSTASHAVGVFTIALRPAAGGGGGSTFKPIIMQY